MKILLLHGPNLNLLGNRQTEIYGRFTENDIFEKLKIEFQTIDLLFFQSNSESELINKIHELKEEINGILINAAAFSHTSIAIADALKSINKPCISIHISNIYKRESYRHNDLVGESCNGSIVGLGIEGYTLAMECLLDQIHQL